MKQQLLTFLKKIQSYFPTKLPVGMTEFQTWLNSVVELAGPIADTDSLKWVISNEIMRLSPGRDRIAKNSMVKLLRKYAANQLAAATVMDLKAKQEAAAKAAQTKSVEDTTAQETSTSGQSKEAGLQ